MNAEKVGEMRQIRIFTGGHLAMAVEITQRYAGIGGAYSGVGIILRILQSLYVINGRISTLHPRHKIDNIQFVYSEEAEQLCKEKQWHYEIITIEEKDE